ncbi:unnamed protein product [Scytosiphon promiscuus]
MGKSAAEGGDGGNSSHIRTFLRVRPSKRPSGFINVDEYDKTKLGFHVPVETKDGEYVNNTRTSHNFKFDGVLGEKATQQEDVFAKIGKGAVYNVLDGYNSTVFAYGQTGSGKTFTVTGGAERRVYVDRGLIPRALSLIFAEFKERSDQQFTCHVSYLEIYNEQGFDLLDPSHDSKKLEELPKVALMEDEDGNIHLRNLSVYLAANEEEALNYLFLGDTNRAISETAMNKASSRSHCIFTISVEGRKHGSEKVMRSKLHLVDLAGSERVHKTQTGGQTLVEAKHINVSLFFLEMVIVALRERGTKGRQHIPYRNSMMTSVLRDSLGGNCKTVMIATVNAEMAQTDESISTCRFAQRVSTIKNEARVNEDVDPGVLIRRLRSECATLNDEVAFLKGESGDGEELTTEEAEDLKNRRCRIFVEDPAPGAQLSIGAYTLTKLKRCFSVFKAMVMDGGQALMSSNSRSGVEALIFAHAPLRCSFGLSLVSSIVSFSQLLSLQDALRQRDNEIAILVNMLKQGRCHVCAAANPSASPATRNRPGKGGITPDRQHDPGGKTATAQSQKTLVPLPASAAAAHSLAREASVPVSYMGAGSGGVAPKGTVGGRDTGVRFNGNVGGVAAPSDSKVLGDPQRAFGYFRERHSGKEALEENKKLLGEKYARAKAMGERVNQARNTIQYLKNTIEQVRRERALDGLVGDGGRRGDGEDDDDDERQMDLDEKEDEEETKCKAAIEVEKRVYKGSFQELRELKSEIEHIQRLLEKGRSKMQADFQSWYEPLLCSAKEEKGVVAQSLARPVHVGEAGPDRPQGVSSRHGNGGGGASRAVCDNPSHGNEQVDVLESRLETRSGTGEVPIFGGDKGGGGANTPTRPRPRLNAWGTPPTSVTHRRGPVALSSAVGYVASDGDDKGSDGGGVSNSVSEAGGGAGVLLGAAGGGGVFPPLTGNKEADDDIAAFYRAKKELERRKSVAGGGEGVKI